jgi:hypothetical protein
MGKVPYLRQIKPIKWVKNTQAGIFTDARLYPSSRFTGKSPTLFGTTVALDRGVDERKQVRIKRNAGE